MTTLPTTTKKNFPPRVRIKIGKLTKPFFKEDRYINDNDLINTKNKRAPNYVSIKNYEFKIGTLK